MAVGEEADVADAAETVRHGVPQEAADELVRLQRHDLGLAAVAVVLPSEADLSVIEPNQAAVGDGDAMGVAAEIAEHLLGAGERRLGVDDPVDAGQVIEASSEGGGIGERAEFPGEAQPAAGEGGAQPAHEHVAEAPGEHAHRQEEAEWTGDPACLVRCDAATGDDAVQVGMMVQRLAPGVQHRYRALDTRLGTLQLRIPKLRQGSYFPPFLEARKTSERALMVVIQEAWIGGVSTRRVDELVQAMGLSGISKSTVSKLCRDIDERVYGFLERQIDGEWPYLWLDATYLKQREGGRIVSVAAIIAVAVNTEGKREIVGLHIGPSEAETFWSGFLRSLLKRGLKGVKLVISDAHEGLKAAINRVLRAGWQRCRVHWMRNALAYVPKGQQAMVSAALRQAFLQPDQASARATWRHVADQFRTRFPRLAAFLDDSELDVLAYMAFPAQHRSRLHSTNTLERLNKEVKRRADVVGIFPNEASIIRLIGAVLMKCNDEWSVQTRYMSLEAMAKLLAPTIDADAPQITTQAA